MCNHGNDGKNFLLISITKVHVLKKVTKEKVKQGWKLHENGDERVALWRGLYTPPRVPPDSTGFQWIPVDSTELKSWNVLV